MKTINRELRDIILLDEIEGFNKLKDEMFDGLITTRDRTYPSSFLRLTEVMEKATQVQLSQNTADNMIN